MTFSIFDHRRNDNNERIRSIFVSNLLAEENNMKSKQIHQDERVASTSTKTTINRREFLRLGLVTAGVIALRKAVPVLAGGRGTVTRYPLLIPPGASPYNSFPLSAAPATADLGGGKLSSVLAYNGSFPGPTFRANTGDNVSIQFTNELS